MVDEDGALSQRRQCELLSLSRSWLHRPPRAFTDKELKIMNHMDKLHQEDPSAGARRLALYLERDGLGSLSRKRVRRFMRLMGMEALYPRPRTTIQAKGRQPFPYLLRDCVIERPNQVWCADITYIPMRRGFMYLFAIRDWHLRKIEAWELSNTLDADFCVQTLHRAMARYGVPEIMNTDQGCQFTSEEWIGVLKSADVSISMDGKGCWRDNVVIERFWRSVKHEDLYLCMYEDGDALKAGIAQYVRRYNSRRPHQSLGGQTPDEVYTGGLAA